MNDKVVGSQRSDEKVEISIQLDSDLIEQIKHLTNDPSRVIETAIKQWLRGERGEQDDDLSRSLRRNPPVPPRGEWND
ncbi:MAG: type II toxin-antitoxin system CcdA family antitoxin [Oscillatoria sp. PMC 1051.18]|uniref:type II toxin-antitoxin system CcdA family antitoxin n=1 Tax=Oscillatoria salina TaxID=331517 RepID=UPI0013BE51AC|nr:type II toxin-antitoxin system CcdA family antitoxin [Oscillatoria salina]MBZ8181760.1 type II toxin-antitoxin system CcdA family antitoxin [Oscillatoria salina IIICB1]MEC4891901.1 type II toxin-antitoxin system CcdA family antitoxin [Oscillatoria sp. PMC 1050.18]MEC5030859.1 type II toxin-antitoxin system CcdA family antitoxin [Oscillatoria sp. PMC 1051.18]NET90395.1 type II toxin-antitoxin system CcdA family antitoxin [Kamptonema sp. SIO1D9]